MGKLQGQCKKPLTVLLATIFVVAQAGALAHAYEHDPGSPQIQACSTCVAGHSLSSACVESKSDIELQHCNAGVDVEQTPVLLSVHLPLARQRAPPTPL